MIGKKFRDIQFKKLREIDIQIAYQDKGIGESTLVFLHGLGNAHLVWERNIEGLSPHARCIALDLPGNGFSSKAQFPYSIDFFAHTVATFIREMNLPNPILVGHSMGGQIAMRIGFLFPDLIQKIVLVAPAGLEKFTSFEQTIMTAGMQFFDFGMTDAFKLKEALTASFYKQSEASKKITEQLLSLLDEHPGQHYKTMIEQCVQAMLNEPTHPYIQKLEQSVLLIFGTMDALIPNKILHPYATESLARQTQKKFADCDLLLVPFAGHFVQWEQSVAVNQAILAFMNKK